MKKSFAVVVCLVAVGALLGPAPASALTVDEEAKLVAQDGQFGEEFGMSGALDGDTALVGARFGHHNGLESGTAYIFVRTGDGWTEQAKLVPDDAAAEDFYGYSVALDGDTAVIGAIWDDDNGYNSGSAYVFVRTGEVWTEQVELLASDGEHDNFFGSGVALDGDTAVVGAYYHDENGTHSGAAYVFVRAGDEWTEQAKLLTADGSASDYVGWHVALAGDTAVLGALGADGTAENSGAAYVFTRTGEVWTEQAKLFASDGGSWDQFGRKVAVHGDTALIGAYGDTDNGLNSGSAYVFTRSAGVWTEQAKLLASDGDELDWFGHSVSVYGDTAVVGAYGNDGSAPVGGAAYVFTRTGEVWTEQAKLLASDGGNGQGLGTAVSIDGDGILVGAWQAHGTSNNTGAAYVFRLLPCGNGILDPGEECDDGNNVDGDGCAADCAIEEDVPAMTGIGVMLLALAVGGGAVYFLGRRSP